MGVCGVFLADRDRRRRFSGLNQDYLYGITDCDIHPALHLFGAEEGDLWCRRCSQTLAVYIPTWILVCRNLEHLDALVASYLCRVSLQCLGT